MSSRVYRFSDIHSGKMSFHFTAFETVTRFCQMCTRRYSFWLAVAVFALLEPILCSQYPTVRQRIVQTFVLAVSTILYAIQLIGVATREWEKIVVIEAMARLGTISIKNPLKDFTALKLLVFFAAEGEYVLEGIMIALGWILLWWRPGLATLRCFRVFRILWFYEVEVFKDTTVRIFSPFFGAEFVVRGFKVLKFAINALTALGNEIFRLTNETRGGLLLIMIFFYSAYVLGATLYIETGHDTDLCESIGACTWTLVRLTFFDGNGLDFAYYLTKDHRILFVIVLIYMCITSFGILNGLVGVFGTALARASHLAFEDDESDDAGAVETNDDDDGSFRGDTRPADKGQGDAGKDDEDEEDVQAYNEQESPAPRFAGAGGTGGAGTIPVDPQLSADMKKSLRDMLRGPSSRFVVNHFNDAPKASPGEAAANAARLSNMFASPARKRFTIKDVARAVADQRGSMASTTSAAVPEEIRQLRSKPSAAAGGFANMFAVGGTNGRSLPQKSSRNLFAHHASSAGHSGAVGADSRAMLSNMVEIHQMVDRQTKLINVLMRHVTTLSRQLERAVPGLEIDKDWAHDAASPVSSGYNVKDLMLHEQLPTGHGHGHGHGHNTGQGPVHGLALVHPAPSEAAEAKPSAAAMSAVLGRLKKPLAQGTGQAPAQSEGVGPSPFNAAPTDELPLFEAQAALPDGQVQDFLGSGSQR